MESMALQRNNGETYELADLSFELGRSERHWRALSRLGLVDYKDVAEFLDDLTFEELSIFVHENIHSIIGAGKELQSRHYIVSHRDYVKQLGEGLIRAFEGVASQDSTAIWTVSNYAKNRKALKVREPSQGTLYWNFIDEPV